MEMKVVMQPKSKAKVELPGRGREEVGSGEWNWSVEWEEDWRFPPKVVQPPCCAPVRNEWVP